jgi:hypothetical protein
VKIFIGAILGGVIGFAIGYVGKCSSGMCPLTSNPIISAIIGFIFGAMIMMRR